MARKTIMLACSAGMSTSLLVSKMKKVAADDGLDYEIFAVPIAEVKNKIEGGQIDGQSIDCILLGPQVRFMESEYKESFKPYGIVIGVIPMQDYGMMNGAKVVAFARSLMGE